MDVRIKAPRSYVNLPQREKDKISEWVVELAKYQLERDGRIMLDLYIKMVCVVLHDAFGFGEKRLLMFLGNHKRLFHRQHKMVKEDTQIVSMMPSHRSYLEPFFGSGAVLFNKPPSAIETVNDIDGDIVNFFRVLRESPDELIRLISMTPYAREVFDDAHENRGATELDRAYRFAIRSQMGHGFKTYQKTGFKIDVHARERSYCVDCWNKMPEALSEAALRLKQVQIESRPALELIKKFNHDNVLIYADPPYLLNTRGGKQYRHEMDEQDHVELLAALCDHKGYVILSGYPSEMYDSELRGWQRITKKSYNQNSDPRTEVLWCNFTAVPTLFDGGEITNPKF